MRPRSGHQWSSAAIGGNRRGTRPTEDEKGRPRERELWSAHLGGDHDLAADAAPLCIEGLEVCGRCRSVAARAVAQEAPRLERLACALGERALRRTRIGRDVDPLWVSLWVSTMSREALAARERSQWPWATPRPPTHQIAVRELAARLDGSKRLELERVAGRERRAVGDARMVEVGRLRVVELPSAHLQPRTIRAMRELARCVN